MVTILKELISIDFRGGVIFGGLINSVTDTRPLYSNQGGVAGIEYIKVFLFTKPTTRRSGWIRILKGGI